MKPTKQKIFSIGHSNVPIDIFLNKLSGHRIGILVDVRTIPMSRFCPHFSKNALQSALAQSGIQYLYRGKNMGGRGENEGYEEAIDELVGLTHEGVNVCVMCSEGDYHKCHRFTMLTPSFEKRGLTVQHIEYEKSKRPKNI